MTCTADWTEEWLAAGRSSQKWTPINPIDSHYCCRGRHTLTGCTEASCFSLQTVFLSPFLGGSSSLCWCCCCSCCFCWRPMLLCFWKSREPINVCSQRGTEHSESQPFPQAMSNKEAETAQRETEARGVDNMFPLLLNTERTNMITGMLACSLCNDWVISKTKIKRSQLPNEKEWI